MCGPAAGTATDRRGPSLSWWTAACNHMPTWTRDLALGQVYKQYYRAMPPLELPLARNGNLKLEHTTRVGSWETCSSMPCS